MTDLRLRRADRSTILLGGATVALGVVAALLSRRDRVPTLPGIDPNALEPLAHVGMALALALVAAVLARSIGVRRAAFTGFVVSVSLTIALEVAQVSLATRSANVEDALLNVTGAAFGAVGAHVLMRSRTVSPRNVAAGFVLLGLVGGGWALQADVALGRACDQVVTEVTSLADPLPVPPVGPNALAYDLSAAVGNDVLIAPEVAGGPSLFGPQATAIASSPRGLVLSRDGNRSGLRSQVAGNAVSVAVQETEVLVIQAIFTPFGDDRGPAPIVAISGSSRPSDMNVHLGQHGDELSIRLRLGCGQFNWTRIPGVLDPGVRRDVVVSYNAGTQRVWVDGRLVDERVFVGDNVSTVNWDVNMPLVVGSEVNGDRPFFGEIESVRIEW